MNSTLFSLLFSLFFPVPRSLFPKRGPGRGQHGTTSSGDFVVSLPYGGNDMLQRKSLESVKQDLERVVGYITCDELTDIDKETITRETVASFNAYLNPGIIRYRKSVSTDFTVIERTDYEGYVEGLNGEKFIDCLGGFGVYNFGHRNPEILNVVKKQLDKQALNSLELIDFLRGYLARTVADITPGDLTYCTFTSGGAEAVEMALKLARIATEGYWFISAINDFHGKSMGALSVTGKANYRAPFMPILQQVRHVPFGSAEKIDAAISNMKTVGEDVAAVILEPIQGEAGVIVPPEGYLRAVREICDRQEVALIFDEIQTGMGRTGTIWRCDAEGVTPDILIFGKAFGGGILPITGLICRPDMWCKELVDNPNLLGSPTFGGNALCCSAALAAIKYMLDHDVPAICKEKGQYLKGGLASLKERYPEVIKDIRGVGLMLAAEFHTTEIGYDVAKGLFSRHVLTGGTELNAKCVRFEPTCVITYDDMDAVIDRLDESLTDTKEAFQL